ncbi:hypothetical protein ACX27O_16280 [Micromonospora sp. SD19]
MPALFFARVYYFANMKRYLKYPADVPLVFTNIPTKVKRELIIGSTLWRVLYTGSLAGSTILADKIIAAQFGDIRGKFFPWVFVFLALIMHPNFTLKASNYWTADRVCAEFSSSAGNEWQRDSGRLCRMAATDCVVVVMTFMLAGAGLVSFLNLAVFTSSFKDPPAGFADNDLIFVYAVVAFEISVLLANRLTSRFPEFMVVSQVGKLNSKRRERFGSSPYDPLGVVREEIFVLARYVVKASAKLERSVSKDATFAPSVVLRAGAEDLLRFLASRESLDNNTMPKRLVRNSSYLLALMVDTPSRSFYDKVSREWKAFDEQGQPAERCERVAPRRIEAFLLKYGQPGAASLQFLIQGGLAVSIVALVLFGKVDIMDFIKTFIK